MVSPDLVEYVKQNMNSFTREQIFQTLISSGYTTEGINGAFELSNLANQSMIKPGEVQSQINNTEYQEQTQQNINQEQINTQNNLDNEISNTENKPNQLNMKTILLILPITFVLFVGIVSGIYLLSDGTSNEISQQNPTFTETENAGNTIPSPNEIHENENELDESLDQDLENNDDNECRINVFGRDVELNIGQARGLISSGYRGDVTEIQWAIEDDEIGRIMPRIGSASSVTGLKEGETRITVTDTSVGEDCAYRIRVIVNE